MLFALLLLAVACSAPELVLSETCDIIELNHFYDDEGQKVFDQVIFLEWDGRRHQVLDWRLVKEASQRPQRDWSAEQYQSLWVDQTGDLRRVRSRSYRETWTQYDPELVEREELPKERRRLLRKPTLKRRVAP